MTKAARTRQFIIEQAAPIINKKGMAATAISDIMEATKLAKGGIYGNFESKDEICREVFHHLATALSLRIDDLLSAQNTARGKLFALLDYYTDNLLLSDNGGCPILNFGVEADDTSPLIRKSVEKAIRFSQNKIKNIVLEGIAAGEFRACIDAELFGIKMFAMLEGAIFVGRVQHDDAQMKIISGMLKNEVDAFAP